MTSTAPIRLIIVDDHPLVREGIRGALSSTGFVVLGDVGNAEDAIALARRDVPDVVVMDITLPGMNGIEAVEVLRREHPALPVLMLSTYPEKQYAVRCIRLGAGGYLNKSADPDDMVAAVRKVAFGGLYVTAATAEALAVAVGGAFAKPGPGVLGLDGLSHREHQVFRLLTAGQTVSEIGAQLKLAPNTVSTYRARILEKTGAKNDVELALYAERHSRAASAA